MKILAYAFLILLPVTMSASTVVIVQTNSAGDNIHLIDPATNKVVKIIKDIEVPHGAAMAPDGSRMYVTNESLHTLDFVDMKTLKVTRQVKLSGRPNNLSISKDGRRVYVAIREVKNGAVDVIDTASATLARSIPHPEVHNTFVTPDGRFVVAGSISGKRLTMIDQKTEEPAWSLEFDRGVRPITFEQNADGSTRRLFVQLSDYHGFAVVDVATRKEVARIDMPEIPAAERHTEGLQGSPGHGIGVSPDGTQLWMCSKVNSHVYAYSLPDLKYLGGVHVGSHPDWLTFSPDGTLYVANAGSNSVSVVDTKAMREITRVAVGQVPKRNITAVLP
jgi:YVTN family beta-propeller protein